MAERISMSGTRLEIAVTGRVWWTFQMNDILAIFLSFSVFVKAAEKPNVVIIFCDDLGYGDIGCFGAEGYKTPHIDSIAKDGAKFTDFYVAQAVCSASRAALMTGCYSNRVGISGALSHRSKNGLNPNETTIAELLKGQGYATAAFGKWHLGYQKKFLPVNQGFDEYHGYPYSNDMWPRGPIKFVKGYPDLPVFDNDKISRRELDQSEMTNTLTKRAVSFIEKTKDAPFFLYLAHPQPHVPLYVSGDRKGSSEKGIFGDVIQEIDWSTGEVLRALEKKGVVNNTFVIFTSDNGPWMVFGNHAGNVGDLRGSKGTSWEGGVRVPCVMRFPGKIKAGSVVKTPLMTIDLLPTIAGLVSAPLPKKEIDGKDAWKVITGEQSEPVQEAYFFYYRGNDLESMRMGKWKLQFPHNARDGRTNQGKDGHTGKYGREQVQLGLYDLEVDRGERTDVKGKNPEVLSKMQALADQKRVELGDGLKKIKGAENRQSGKAPLAEWAR